MTPHRNAAWQGILTPSQAEVIELAAQGLTNAEIAHARETQEDNSKVLLTRAYKRLGVRNRVEAARWWIVHVESPKRTT